MNSGITVGGLVWWTIACTAVGIGVAIQISNIVPVFVVGGLGAMGGLIQVHLCGGFKESKSQQIQRDIDRLINKL